VRRLIFKVIKDMCIVAKFAYDQVKRCNEIVKITVNLMVHLKINR